MVKTTSLHTIDYGYLKTPVKPLFLSHIYCYWHYQIEKMDEMGLQFFGPPWTVTLGIMDKKVGISWIQV